MIECNRLRERERERDYNFIRLNFNVETMLNFLLLEFLGDANSGTILSFVHARDYEQKCKRQNIEPFWEIIQKISVSNQLLGLGRL